MTDEPLTLPPVPILNTLDEYARDGDFVELLQYLEQLEQEERSYHQFVTIIQRYAKNFQEEEIRTLLAYYRKEQL